MSDGGDEQLWIARSARNADAFAKAEAEFFAELDRRLVAMTPEQREAFLAERAHYLAREIETAPAPAGVKTYKLKRWHNGRRMAEGAEVRATGDAEAVAKARALFSEPEHRHDRFEIEAVD